MTYKNNQITYQYNDMHKITKVFKGGKETASYTYDVRGNIKTKVNDKLTTELLIATLYAMETFKNSQNI